MIAVRDITRIFHVRRGVLAAAVVWACMLTSDAPAMQDQTAAVRVRPVERRTVEETRRVTGDLRAVSRSDVATREAGRKQDRWDRDALAALLQR